MSTTPSSPSGRDEKGPEEGIPTDFILTRYRIDCYHCRKIADQIIKAVPNMARVVCENCGASRIFIPKIEDVAKAGTYEKIGCYDIWKIESTATCRNCHVTGAHDLTIGCRHFVARCRNCGFTHFYKFDVEYMAPLPVKEDGSPAE